MKLEMSMMAGPESKAFLVELTKQVDRLEKLTALAKDPVIEKEDAPEANDSEEEDDSEDFAPKAKKSAKKAKPAFDEEDDEEETVEADDSDDAEDEEPAPKKKKVKAITLDDVNDAAIKLAQSIGGKAGRAKVLAILEKKFKTQSVTALKPDQYESAVKALSV